MMKPHKKPARPYVQRNAQGVKARCVKKRRRQHVAEIRAREQQSGLDAATHYFVKAAFRAPLRSHAESFAANGWSGALKRSRLAIGKRVLGPLRSADAERVKRRRASAQRRRLAVLAQTARRAGRFKMKASSFDFSAWASTSR